MEYPNNLSIKKKVKKRINRFLIIITLITLISLFLLNFTNNISLINPLSSQSGYGTILPDTSMDLSSEKQSNSGYAKVIEEGWKITYSTDEDLELRVKDIGKKQTEICLVNPSAKSIDEIDDIKNIYDSKGILIESLSKQTTTLSAKQEFGYCYIIKDESYLKFGEHSTIVEYQDENKINYEFDWGSLNITLISENDYNITLFHDDINGKWIFGGNVSMEDGVLDNFTYQVDFTDDNIILIDREIDNYTYPYLYVYQPDSSWNEKRHIISFDGLCSSNYSNCEWNLDGRTFQLNFTSNNTILTKSITNVSSCKTLSTANTYYQMNESIIDNELSANCIIISGANITFDGNGYYISSNDNYVGVYSNQFNTTIKNCNISMGNGSGGYGIYLYSGADYSTIDNCTMHDQYTGVYDYYADGGTYTNLIFYGNNVGFLTGEVIENITVNNITAYNNIDSGLLFGTNFIYGKVYNINSSSNGAEGVETYGKNSHFENLTLINNGGYAGFHVVTGDNNKFVNILSTGSVNRGLRTTSAASNNTFINCNFLNNPSYDVHLDASGDVQNFFINCSYNDEQVDAGAELIRKWYYNAYVNDTNSNPIEGASVSSYNNLTIYDGLIGYWKFNNDSKYFENSSFVYDFSGNGDNGTWFGDIDSNSGATQYGVVYGGYNFDGDGDFLKVANSNTLNISNMNFSLAFWIKREMNDANYRFVFGNGLNEADGGWAITLDNNDEISIWSQESFDVDVGENPMPNVGEWYFVVLNYNDVNNTFDLFVNSEFEGESVTLSEIIGLSVHDYHFGIDARDETGYDLNGSLDEFMLYNRKLTGIEMNTMYYINSEYFNIITNSLGYTNITDIVDYRNFGGTKYYHGDYNLTASKSGYDSVNHIVNITSLNTYLDNFELTGGVPPEDTIPPYFTSTQNITIPENESVSVDFDADDETAFSCFAVNDTVNFAINCDGLLTNITALSTQKYNLNITINDTSNNLNSTIIWVNVTAFVTDTNPPYFTYLSNLTIYENTSVLLDLNASDDESSIDSWVVNNTVNFAIDHYGNLTNITGLSAGRYNLNITINDTYGNINSSVIWINVSALPDTTLPIIFIQFPTNTSYSEDINYLNYTYVEDNPNRCWFSNNTGELNSTPVVMGTNFTSLVSIEGSNNWTVWCNDTAGNLNTTSVSFVKDTVPPYFTDLANLTIYNNESVLLDLNASDTTTNISCFAVNDTVNFAIDCYGNLTNITALTPQRYNLNITINDTLNNINSTVIWINVSSIPDTSPPNFDYLENVTVNYGNESVYLGIIASDGEGNFDSYAINDTTYFLIGRTTGIIENITTLSSGIYNLNITINDTSGNINTSVIWINVTKAIPHLTLTLSPSNSETYGTSTTATGTGCPVGIYCNLTRDDVEVPNPETSVFAVGSYVYIYNTSGSENYTTASETDTLTITQATGLVYAWINGTRNNFTSVNGSATQNIWINGTLETGDGEVRLYLNETFIQSGSSPVNNLTNLTIGYYNFTASYSGNENYTASNETFWINVTEFVDNPPTFDNLRNFSIETGDSFSQSITASDDDAIDSYWLNETGNFTINKATGLITNVTATDIVFKHNLIIYVNDTAGQITSGNFYINITLPIAVVVTGLTADDMYIAYNYENTIQGDMRFSYGWDW